MKTRRNFSTLSEFYDYLEPLAAENNIPRRVVARRINGGWSPERAVSRPVTSKPDMNHPYKQQSFNTMKERKANANR